MHINCTKNEEIFDGKLHFLCSDKSAAYLKKHVVLQSSKHEELTFACTFIFAFIPYFIGGNIVKKLLSKNIVKSVRLAVVKGHIGGLSIERGFNP